MSLLNAEILQLLEQPATTRVIAEVPGFSRALATRVLATADETGAPYAVPTPFLGAIETGELVHLELLEKSTTNRNLLRTLWFDKKVSVTLAAPGGRSFVIHGKPVKALISGPLFRAHYEQVRSVLGDADLAAVWLIEPEQVVEETYAVRKQEEEERFPFTIHLDRLLAVPGEKPL